MEEKNGGCRGGEGSPHRRDNGGRRREGLGGEVETPKSSQMRSDSSDGWSDPA